MPGSSCSSNARSRPSGVSSRSAIVTRCARGRSPGLIAKRDRSDAIGYSSQASRTPCSQYRSMSSASGGPVMCASACLVPPGTTVRRQRDAAPRRAPEHRAAGPPRTSPLHAQSRPLRRFAAGHRRAKGRGSRRPRSGTSTSRMACSGTRTRNRSRPPSGLRNAWTMMSFGMSWANEDGTPTARAVTTATRTAVDALTNGGRTWHGGQSQDGRFACMGTLSSTSHVR